MLAQRVSFSIISHHGIYAGGVKHRLFGLPERLYSKRGEIRFGRAGKAGSQNCKLTFFQQSAEVGKNTQEHVSVVHLDREIHISKKPN